MKRGRTIGTLIAVVLLLGAQAFGGIVKFPIVTVKGGDPALVARTDYDINGDIIVWQDDRNKIPDQWNRWTWDIYGYNLTTKTEFPICTQTNNQISPRISGNTVIWGDERTSPHSIYGFDLARQQEFLIRSGTTFSFLGRSIDNNIVVWEDIRFGREGFGSSIYAYNLTTKTEQLIRSAVVDPVSRSLMCNRVSAISGNTIVWFDQIPPHYGPPDNTTSPDIYGYNLATGAEFPICKDSSEQKFPATNGNVVVYYDGPHGIAVYDITTATKFYPGSSGGGYRHPDIDGNIVVWEEGSRIYGYDLSTSSLFLIVEGDGGVGAPRISGNTVIWMERDNIIYGAIIPEPASLTILFAGAGFLILRRRLGKVC